MAEDPNRHTFPTGVDLYWLPLGAGGHCVKYNGRAYEWLAARIEGRPAYDLYHSGIEVHLPEARWVIEQTPVPDMRGADRGVVAEGPVGSRWAGRFRLFRYEIRAWPGGSIPDVAEAVDGPRRLTDDEALARRVLDVTEDVPRLVWGRDQVGAGEMWNSNAVIAWILKKSGIGATHIKPPPGESTRLGRGDYRRRGKLGSPARPRNRMSSDG